MEFVAKIFLIFGINIYKWETEGEVGFEFYILQYIWEYAIPTLDIYKLYPRHYKGVVDK